MIALMRHATLRQLEVFEAVARQGSFSRAAAELGLSQPTVSTQVRKLADEVGLPLFEPVGRRVRLSEAGKALFETCQDIFGTLSRFETVVAGLQGLTAGTLRVAAAPTAKYFIPRFLGQFHRQYPQVKMELQIVDRNRLLERLVQQRDDLTVMSRPPREEGLKAVPFLANPLVAVASIHHPLARQRAIEAERFAREPLLVREAGSGTRQAVEEFFAERNLPLRVEMELPNNEAIKQAVLGGMGVAVLSRHALGEGPGEGELTVLDVAGMPLEGHWYAVLAGRSEPSPLVRAFLDFLLERARLQEGRSVAV
ncbi:MAG: LysR family transcriptional regulator [Candidatus Competibacteraceae bacterium]|nr:LysR family transcriptional regulator [Candidatus Competibacteraceae bacterium]